MIQSQFLEDYVTGAARETMGRTITETDIVLHAGQTGDFYPHHMDAEWCKTQDFKQRIAHGTLIFSVAVGMTAGAINPEAFSYGYDRLRFTDHRVSQSIYLEDPDGIVIELYVDADPKKAHPRSRSATRTTVAIASSTLPSCA